MIEIRVPSALADVAGLPSDVVEAEGLSVKAVLVNLTKRYPSLIKHFTNVTGQIDDTPWTFFMNGKVVGLDAKVGDTDEIEVIASMSGGRDDLTTEEVQHYARHLTLPNVGRRGQLKLKNATVLVIGAGGLGAPVALYLAAGGVGHVILIDHDTVEASNLQRQVIHDMSGVGMPKVESAKSRMLSINPHINVEAIQAPIGEDNVAELVARADVVIDGTDNFNSRLLINRACVLAKKPLVFAAIHQFTGQVSVFNADALSPCYRCLFPNVPTGDLAPNCAAGGVIGALPGVMGTWQASEAIKLILGIGQPLSGRLIMFDMLSGTTRKLEFHKREDCPECGPNRRHDPISVMCAANLPTSPLDAKYCLDPLAFKAAIAEETDAVLLDVREPGELEICRLESAVNIPVAQIEDRITELDPAKQYLVFCKSGGRSNRAANVLLSAGFRKVRHMTGGLQGWQRDVDPDLIVI